jgi:hypothetical protein
MDIRRDPSISPMIDVNARQLLDQIREITRDS